MTRITREQAKKLRDGVGNIPWKAVKYDGGRIRTGHISDADGFTIGAAEAGFVAPEFTHGQTDLLAAAPDLAETVIAQADEIEHLKAQIGGMTAEWGVEIDRTDAVMDGSTRHVMATTRRPSDQIMKIWAEDGRNPIIVRRRVGTWEVMDE